MKTTARDAATSDAFVEACGERLAQRAVFRHYSRARILGVRARATFVDPDLSPLPRVS